MYYLFIGTDVEDSLPKRKVARPEHLARLHALQEEGRLLLAGPMPKVDGLEPGDAGFYGSIIVAEFASLADAEAWGREEPYLKSGAYTEVKVYPFKKVLP